MKYTSNPFQKYWWHEEQVATFKQMAKDGASLGEICKAFPNRKMENIILMARHISALNSGKVSEKNKALRDNQKNNFTDIYAERGRKWTDMDDQRLMTMFFQLYSEDEISEQLQRSITAIQKRIMELHPSNSDKARLFERIRPYIGLKATGKKTVVAKKRSSCNVVSDDALEMVNGIENLEFFLEEDDQWRFHDSLISDIKWDFDNKTVDLSVIVYGYSTVEYPEKGYYVLDFHFLDVVCVDYQKGDDYIYNLDIDTEYGNLTCEFDTFFLKVVSKKLIVDAPRIEIEQEDDCGTEDCTKELEPLSVSEESRNGQRWTQEESEMVADLFNQGYKPTEIAKHVGRTERAILAKLGSLGIIDYEYNRDSEQS